MSIRTLALNDILYQYLLDHSLREHPEQTALRVLTQSHPMGHMQIAPEQGELMQLLVKLIGARRSVEIGVFTGYSALTVALALPLDGHLLACDMSAEYTAVALPFWRRAGVADKIELVLGPALDTLDARLAAGAAESYDFSFIDADKTNYTNYYERCLKLLRIGGLMAIDNVLWSGKVAMPADPVQDPDTAALQRFNANLRHDPRIELAMVPVGDGLTLVRKCSSDSLPVGK